MIGILGRTVAAEFTKLLGLPTVVAAVVGTSVASGAVASVVVAAADPVDAALVVTRTVPLLQAGLVVVGVLTIASEHQGSQLRTTLVANPDRRLLLIGKVAAYLIVATITSAACVAAGLGGAWTTLTLRHGHLSAPVEFGPVAGAGAYLVLIGLLGFALALPLRSVVAPLATVLLLVLVASPLAAAITEHARWLPDRAGSLLYRPDTDPVLTRATGALVLIAWIAASVSAAAGAFALRDS